MGGTILYMAPETIYQPTEDGRKKFGAMADVWALGIILYQLLHQGATPWDRFRFLGRVSVGVAIANPEHVIKYEQVAAAKQQQELLMWEVTTTGGAGGGGSSLVGGGWEQSQNGTPTESAMAAGGGPGDTKNVSVGGGSSSEQASGRAPIKSHRRRGAVSRALQTSLCQMRAQLGKRYFYGTGRAYMPRVELRHETLLYRRSIHGY